MIHTMFNKFISNQGDNTTEILDKVHYLRHIGKQCTLYLSIMIFEIREKSFYKCSGKMSIFFPSQCFLPFHRQFPQFYSC